MKILQDNLILPILEFIKPKYVLDINGGDYEYGENLLSYFLDNNVKLTLVCDSTNIRKKEHKNISFVQNLNDETIINPSPDCILINCSHISEVNLNKLKNILEGNKIINFPLLIIYDIKSTGVANSPFNNFTLEIVHYIINQKNYNLDYHIFNSFYNLGIIHQINKKWAEFIIKQYYVAQNLISKSDNNAKSKFNSSFIELKERNVALSVAKQEQFEKLVEVQSDNKMLVDRLRNLEKEYLSLNDYNEELTKVYTLSNKSKGGCLILNDFKHDSENSALFKQYNSMVLFNRRMIEKNNYLKKKNQELSEENQELCDIINSFKNSRSWKYTSSLRNINNKLTF